MNKMHGDAQTDSDESHPAETFPYKWAIHRWIVGQPVSSRTVVDLDIAVRDLSDFLLALHSIDLPDAPPSERSVPIDTDEDVVLWAIRELGEEYDASALEAIWRDAVSAPTWQRPLVLVHADLMNGNMLARDGRIAAIIDWGLLGLGEPANDLDPAWELFDQPHRRTFGDALEIDDATWARARGWAVKSAIGILYYRETNASMVSRCRARLNAVLDDAGRL